MKRIYSILFSLLLGLTVVRAAVLVGRTEGNLSVSPTGAATYTIPLNLQPGMSDFMPQLSLSYNSQSGNGLAGYGWNVSGLSAISIAPRNVWFDGTAECIYRGEDNAYYLDGMRLLLVSGMNGQAGAIYRTENEQYSRIEITSMLDETPATFTVKTTDGTTYKYGNSTGRLQLNTSEAYQWTLDYAEDRLGNYITFTYAQEGMLYPTLVSYGRNVHGDKGVTCTVAFSYESRTDSLPTYLFGTRSRCSRRLKSVTCKYDGNTYRTYTLAYDEGTFSHLRSVTEGGTSSASYSPTVFTWQDLPAWNIVESNCSLEPYIPNEDFSEQYFFTADTDNDGVSEIVGLYNTAIGGLPLLNVIARQWSETEGRYALTNTYSTQATIDMDDVMKNIQHGGTMMHVSRSEDNSVALAYAHSNAGQWSMKFYFPREDLTLTYPLSSNKKDSVCYTLADTDNDGRDEILLIESKKTAGTYPAVRLSPDLSSSSLVSAHFSLSLASQPKRIIPADFNADGMTDLLVLTRAGHYIYWNRNGNYLNTDRYYSTAFGDCDITELGDFNGDGLPDMVINKKQSTDWYLALNAGNDSTSYFSLHEISQLKNYGAKKGSDKDSTLFCMVQDFDLDGKSDMLVGFAKGSYPNGAICVLKSHGTTFSEESLYTYTSKKIFPRSWQIVQGDFDGDGVPEILFYGRAANGSGTDKGWHTLAGNGTVPSTNRMIAVRDGLGATDSIRYDVLTNPDIYDVSGAYTNPYLHLHGAFPVVSEHGEYIPNDSRTTTYRYANGVMHRQGKGFLGFEEVEAVSSTGLTTIQHSELDTVFCLLKPVSRVTQTASGTIVVQDSTHTSLVSAGGRAYRMNNEDNQRREIGEYSSYTSSDNYINGQPRLVESIQVPFNEVKNITYWQSSNGSVWIKNLPSQVVTTKSETQSGSDDVTETTTYTRNPDNGLVAVMVQQRNGATVGRTEYSYNECGQVTSERFVPYSTSDTLTTTYTYNDKGQLTSKTNPRGLTTFYSYRSNNGMLLLTRSPQNVPTYCIYDGMLRKTRQYSNASNEQDYFSTSSYPGAAYLVRHLSKGHPVTFVHYDAWGRKVAEGEQSFTGQAFYTNYTYGSNGEVAFKSYPHAGLTVSSTGTSYTYDYAHRLVSTTDTQGKTSTWTYGEMETTSVIDGVTTTTGYYVPGVVAFVEDDAGWVDYEYNADREVKNIYSGTNTYGDFREANYGYDTFGRLTQVTDMNGVTRRYTYDAHGHPLSVIHGTSYVRTDYDKYGILRSRARHDGTDSTRTEYTYDRYDRLTRETGPMYQHGYSYDKYDRLTSESHHVTDSTRTYYLYSGYTYNSENQLERKTSTLSASSGYPSIDLQEYDETYTYAYGHCTQKTLNDSLIWQLQQTDTWGRPVSVHDHLNTTTRSYDNYGHMLSNSIQGRNSRTETYAYDVTTGNLTQKDGHQLTYDAMNRLTGWGTHTYAYDRLGNITSQPYAGTLAYDEYRLKSLSDPNAQGIGSVEGDCRMTYLKSIERTRTLCDTSYFAAWDYDGSGNRIRMKVHHRDGSHLLTRCYLSDYAELTLENGSLSMLYYAGGDAYEADAVLVSKSDTAYHGKVYQIYRDALGSAILYVSKNDSCSFRYSPWGTRLYYGNSMQTYKPGQKVSPYYPFCRTYTGHEDLWMFGLLNMNARLYSPYIGRFLCPDPLINQDGGPLDFNPYVYARNNPYRYIDRDGELAWFVPLIGALIGGSVNLATNWSNVHNLGDGAFYFMGGAMSGVISSLLPTTGFFGTGIIAGAITGGIGSIASQTLLGGMNAAINGDDIVSSVRNGINWYQVLADAVTGGISGGIQAKQSGANVWTGRKKISSSSSLISSELEGNYKGTPSKADLESKQIAPNDVVKQSLEDPGMPIGSGNSSVYVGYDKKDIIRYVGRTDRMPDIRINEHLHSGNKLSTLYYNPIITNLNHQGSRIIEQQLINIYRLEKNGGQLYNKINSISPKKWGKWGIR